MAIKQTLNIKRDITSVEIPKFYVHAELGDIIDEGWYINDEYFIIDLTNGKVIKTFKSHIAAFHYCYTLNSKATAK